ncbi:MAG: Cupredoxin1 domain-containing protein [Nitrospira sp.]|nr:MAG: Cupredoxin1 domain-containing protein [Nitrospira sp.]
MIQQGQMWRWATMLGLAWVLWSGADSSLWPQSEQVVDVTIQDFKFVTKQSTLRLGVATVIRIKNEDAERHDFGSTMFEGIPTQVEKGGVVVYGRGIGGLLLDAKQNAALRFNMSRPGRHEFRCSIHPNMTGELLLLNVEAV